MREVFGVAPSDESNRVRFEVWREGITMALYVSLSQVAVMTAYPTTVAIQDPHIARSTLLTSVGLILAHQIAFRISSRVVTPGSRLNPAVPAVMRAQLIGGGCVTLLAVLPLAAFGPGAYRVSIALLLCFVMVIGYIAARTAPTSRIRSLIYVVLVAAVVFALLGVKSLVGH